MSGPIRVEVAHARPERQLILELELPPGATVADAIDASGIRGHFEGLAVDDEHVGIFGRACRLDTALRDGDRVELYRDLLADPRESRRRRARE